jgi:hypothetical protein
LEHYIKKADFSFKINNLPCSSLLEHCGTSGTKPNLLTCVNKLVCIIIINALNYHEMIRAENSGKEKTRRSGFDLSGFD